jgi:hypothetical protein
MPTNLTAAERELLRAKARVKLERQIADREFENRHPAVVAAVSVFGILLMIIGVFILMKNNPWRSGPGPLTPIPSTSTITVTPPPTCILTPQMRGCRYPDGPCPRVGPCVTMTPPPPITNLPGLPGSPQWCAQYPNDRENCGPTTTTTPPPITDLPQWCAHHPNDRENCAPIPTTCDPSWEECNQLPPATPRTTTPRGGPGECGYPYSDECGTPAPTTPTTSPFPTELLCDTIKPRPPKCPPLPTPTVTPGVTV